MKRKISFVLFMFVCFATFAQTVTLTFTAKDAANHHVQLNRVAITNLTKSWQEIIYWPDTTLTMQNGTGIDESVTNDDFALSQNNPNPFSITTDVNLTVEEVGAVMMEISDVNGRVVETQNFASLQPGIHQFRVSLSAAGTYVMTARQNRKTSSIKMVCNGGGSSNTINYLGIVHTLTYVLKSNTTNPFNFGDIMEYVGYATINGAEAESQRITQAQGASQAFTMQFDVTQHYAPSATTTSVSDISDSSATCGGNVTSDGGATVTARGVCWRTSHNPTVSNSHTTDGSGTGSFISNITDLNAGTTYFVRAYATNSAGTTYGNEVSFTTINLPVVTTTTASYVTATTAICGGNVTSDGGATVTARGVCWSTSHNPTIANNHSSDGGGNGNYTSILSELTVGTTYYVRAYATNAAGTAYGNEVSFTTELMDGQPCPGAPTVCDVDGNVYNTVQIGHQCWMKENLRTINYEDGNSITFGQINDNGDDEWLYNFPRCYYPYNNSNYVSSHGLLYNLKSILRFYTRTQYDIDSNYIDIYSDQNQNSAYIQGICPNGWHIPTIYEFGQLRIYLSNHSQYWCNNSSNNIAKSLASTSGWMSSDCTCCIGNNQASNNASGFTALPTKEGGRRAGFWSSTLLWNTNLLKAYAIGFWNTDSSIGLGYDAEGCDAASVRCIRNENNTSQPITLVTNISNIMSDSATINYNVSLDNGTNIIEHGLCWSTSHWPTRNGGNSIVGSNIGNNIICINGLNPFTTYFVRAYAITTNDTTYSSEAYFTTSTGMQDNQPCPNAANVIDYDGNVYNTVQIGFQCWMKENLRTTHYANGSQISQGSSSIGISNTTGYWYSTSNVQTYGLLYNWKAVMGDTVSSETNSSGVLGICPNGWHVPSQAEWQQFMAYLCTQENYVCLTDNPSNPGILKALASTTGWEGSSYDICSPYNDPSSNNATGFSALPCNSWYMNYESNNVGLHYWSATEELYSNNAFYFNGRNSSYVSYKERGFPVRCLKN